MTAPFVRVATDADLVFVRSSWKTDFWTRSHAGRKVSRRIFSRGMDARVDRLLPRSRVLVAYFAEVPDEVLGWACLENDVIHYIYVKAAYRRHGIAKGLTIGGVRWYSHAADEAGRAFMQSVGAQYNPFLVE